MALSNQVLTELRHEAEAIKAVLADAERLKPRLAAIESILEGAPSKTTDAGSLSLPDLILRVLEQTGRPVPTADIRRYIERSGWKMKGATPFPARISNELYRLGKTGRIEKRNGGYQLPTGD